MKVRKAIAAMLAVTMSAGMLAGCSAKKVTAEDVVKGMNENLISVYQAADDMMSDGEITADELENAITLIPEGVLTISLKADASAVVTSVGSTMNVSGNVDGNVAVSIDSSDKEFGAVINAAYGYSVSGMSSNQNVQMNVYLIHEEDGYYLYTQVGSTTASREYIGDFSDLLEEPLDVSEYLESMQGKTLTEQAKENQDNAISKALVLKDGTITYNGNKCYQLSADVTGDMLIEVLKNDETYLQSLAEQEMTFDELMANKITGDVSVGDLLRSIAFQCNYYVTADKYELVYFDVNLKDTISNLVNVLVPIVIGSGTQVDLDVTDCTFSYSFDKKDTDVTFDGAYEEAN